MASLKEYRDRIAGVKSTRKITSAMKMVAASKLKKAQEQAEAAQPYAQAITDMMARVVAGVTIGPGSPKLLIGTGKDKVHLIVLVTADRGLCGGFNGNAIKLALQHIRSLEKAGRQVKILCIGRRGKIVLNREYGDRIIETVTNISGKAGLDYDLLRSVVEQILHRFDDGEFDVCSLIYNQFFSVLTQRPKIQQVIPFSLNKFDEDKDAEDKKGPASKYAFEPTEEEILGKLLPRNFGVQVYRAVLDSAAGEQAARMTAMDNATRNAGDMISNLTLKYNRERQSVITSELIEIISGAEAV